MSFKSSAVCLSLIAEIVGSDALEHRSSLALVESHAWESGKWWQWSFSQFDAFSIPCFLAGLTVGVLLTVTAFGFLTDRLSFPAEKRGKNLEILEDGETTSETTQLRQPVRENRRVRRKSTKSISSSNSSKWKNRCIFSGRDVLGLLPCSWCRVCLR